MFTDKGINRFYNNPPRQRAYQANQSNICLGEPNTYAEDRKRVLQDQYKNQPQNVLGSPMSYQPAFGAGPQRPAPVQEAWPSPSLFPPVSDFFSYNPTPALPVEYRPVEYRPAEYRPAEYRPAEYRPAEQNRPTANSNFDGNFVPRPSANWGGDAHQQMRQKQQEEWREALRRQVEEKKIKDEQERLRKLREEREDEERLRRQMNEANAQERRQPVAGPPVEFVHKVASKRPPRRLASPPPSEPAPVHEVRHVNYTPTPSSHRCRCNTNWGLQLDYSPQQNALQRVIDQLKQESANLKTEDDMVTDLITKIRADLRARDEPRTPKPLKKQVSVPVLSPSLQLKGHSDFIPVPTHIFSERPRPTTGYSSVEDSQAKEQLLNLDKLLQF